MGTRRTRVICTVFAVLPLLVSAAAAADAGARAALGTVERISASKGHESQPAIDLSTPTDRSLVVWTDNRKMASHERDVYGRLVGSTGMPVSRQIRISNGRAVGDDQFPDVATNTSAQQFLVVWQDPRQFWQRGVDVFGQRVSITGDRLDTNFRIGGTPASNAGNPAVAFSGSNGDYLVVWQEMRVGQQFGIYGQWVSGAGGLEGTTFKVARGPVSTDALDPDIAWNSDRDEFLVVWQDNRNWASRWNDIWGQRLDGDGAPLGRAFRITGNPGIADEGLPCVGYDPSSGRYLVVWEDWRGATKTIRGRLVEGDGTRIGSDFRISQASTIDSFPNVSAAGDGTGFWVTWSSSDNRVRGRAVAGSGAMGGTVQVIRSGADPASAYNPTLGEWVTVWIDDARINDRGLDIRGRAVEP